jgi:hypothetical protein
MKKQEQKDKTCEPEEEEKGLWRPFSGRYSSLNRPRIAQPPARAAPATAATTHNSPPLRCGCGRMNKKPSDPTALGDV